MSFVRITIPCKFRKILYMQVYRGRHHTIGRETHAVSAGETRMILTRRWNSLQREGASLARINAHTFSRIVHKDFTNTGIREERDTHTHTNLAREAYMTLK